MRAAALLVSLLALSAGASAHKPAGEAPELPATPRAELPALPQAALAPLPTLAPAAVPLTEAARPAESARPAEAGALPSLLEHAPEAAALAGPAPAEGSRAGAEANFAAAAGLEAPAVRPELPASVLDGDEETARSVAEVDRRVQAAVAAGLTPTVGSDLDNTAFLLATRFVGLLRHFDLANGTDYFKELHHSQVDTGNLKDSLNEFLRDRVPSPSRRDDLIRAAVRFVNPRLIQPWSSALDAKNPAVVALLARWKGMGARILYLTARTDKRDESTRVAMTREGFPEGRLILNPEPKVPPPTFKKRRLESLRAEDPSLHLVAFLDDEAPVIGTLRAAHPETAVVKVELERDPDTRLVKTRLSLP